MTRRWMTFALVVFALNFMWEMAQGGLFANMLPLPFWVATQRCLVAAAGDVVITAIAFALGAAVSRHIEWPLVRGRLALGTSVFLVTGLGITIAFERWALATGRWQYSTRMPVVSGVGVSPLVQWIFVPLVSLPLFRMIWRNARVAKD